MTKKIFVIFVIVLIFGAGGFFYWWQNPQLTWLGKAQITLIPEEKSEEEMEQEPSEGEAELLKEELDSEVVSEPNPVPPLNLEDEISEEESEEEEEKEFEGCQKNQLNINIASTENLEVLCGIGSVLAQRIIEERQKELFYTLDDLTRVQGVGEDTLNGIKAQGIACAGVSEEGVASLALEQDDEEEEEIEEKDICWVNINTASASELQKITGVGPVIAQRIAEARPFSSLSDLIRVSGIGETTLQRIITQGCAYASGYTGGSSDALPPSSAPSPEPKIYLSYPVENPADKEIGVILSGSGLKETAYDVKISIENEGTISQIYNEDKEGEDKWQSSVYYLTEVFSGNSFEGQFRLRIREDKNDFYGEADIIARFREIGKTSFLEFKGKINISESEQLVQEQEESDEPVQEEGQVPGPPENFLLDEFFEEWQSGTSTAPPDDWLWSGTAARINQSSEGFVGNYSAELTLTSADWWGFYQYGKTMNSSTTYYTQIWVKGAGVLRLGIKYPGSAYVYYGDVVTLNTDQWTFINVSRIPANDGDDGGLKLNVKYDEDQGISSGSKLLIGAAWLSNAPPPDDWLD